MTYIVTSQYELNQAVAPRLPVATQQYDANYVNQLTNVLRLYFNQLDNILGQLKVDTTGNTKIDGSGIEFSNGSFHQDGNTTLTANMSNVSTAAIQVTSTDSFLSSGYLLIESELIAYTGKTSTTFTGITRGVYGSTNVSHTAGVPVTEALGTASATTSVVIPFTATDISSGVSLSATNNTHIVFSVAGYYNIQFSAQLLNFTTSVDNVTFWFRQNNVDVDYSAGNQSVASKHGSFPGSAIVSWNQVFACNAGDYIELVYFSDSGNTVVATRPAGIIPVHPVSPSVAISATFVSALP